MNKYTLTDFQRDFPSNDVCLEVIFKTRYGLLRRCPKCKKQTKFYRVKSRPSYSCMMCGRHIAPMAGTIFEKTSNPLTTWFFVIYLFGTSKNGVSAKEIQRHTGVTYKTAWRMCTLLRSTMATQLSDSEENVTNDLMKKNFLISIEGTYRHISPKYFSHYLAEFMFRHEHRKEAVTPLLFERVLKHEF